nr:unnamed protein product [Callosobruchus analis]
MDLLLFTRNVTRYYLRFSTKANVKSRNSSTVPRSIVQDSNGHFPQKLSKQLRCSMDVEANSEIYKKAMAYTLVTRRINSPNGSKINTTMYGWYVSQGA